jgi:hypothetical protein
LICWRAAQEVALSWPQVCGGRIGVINPTSTYQSRRTTLSAEPTRVTMGKKLSSEISCRRTWNQET